MTSTGCPLPRVNVDIELLAELMDLPDAPAYQLFRRAREHKLFRTLADCWSREERPLSPVIEVEADYHRRQGRRALETQERLARVAAVAPVKGARIARLYPDGIGRQSGDVDFIAESPAAAWAAAVALLDEGWELTAVMLRAIGKDVHPFLQLECAYEEDPIMRADAVEITSVPLWGNVLTVKAQTQGGADVADAGLDLDLLMVVAEGLERDFGPRDLLDTALIGQALTAVEREKFHHRLADTQLWPEWRMLYEEVSRRPSLAPSLQSMPRPSRAALAWAQAGRSKNALVQLSSPPRALGSLAAWAMLRTERRRWAKPAVRLHEERSAAKAFSQGLLLFGVLLGDERGPLDLYPSGRALVGTTPVGKAAFVTGASLPEALSVEGNT